MKYEALAKDIIRLVGGQENIMDLTHCMTRLRFNLKDSSKADKEQIQELQGVINVLEKGGQFQVVIGTHVEEVYQTILTLIPLKTTDSTTDQAEAGESKNLINRFFDILSGIFIPIVGALAGAGMLKAILAVSTAFGWIDTTSQTYTILFMISDVVFYYLPFFIAISAAKKFNTNVFLALIFAGMLVHPTLTELKALGEPVALFGIPMRLATYSTSVIPIILIVFFQSYVERFAKKISPNAVKIFLVPVITILITAPVGLLLLGPIGSIFGDYLALGFNFLNERVSWLVPTLVGGLFPLLVMTGMHYSIGAAQAVQRASVGYATILAPGALASNMAQSAAVLAVAVKTKDKKLKTLATSVGLSALCGVTEPALYGVTLEYKKPLYATMAAGAIAGFYAGITSMKAWSAGTSNIFSLPIYIGEDNSFMNACITVGIALVLGFTFSFILHKDPIAQVEPTKEMFEDETANELTEKTYAVYAPVAGTIVPLTEVKDEAFSTLAMGNGVAIDPTDNRIYAPFDGTVEMIFKTKHAIGLKNAQGVELLIHIGMDTVQLAGQYFTTHVLVGDQVQKGQLLIEFDRDAISKAGYSCITPVIVTNSMEYLEILETTNDEIFQEELLLTIIK